MARLKMLKSTVLSLVASWRANANCNLVLSWGTPSQMLQNRMANFFMIQCTNRNYKITKLNVNSAFSSQSAATTIRNAPHSSGRACVCVGGIGAIMENAAPRYASCMPLHMWIWVEKVVYEHDWCKRRHRNTARMQQQQQQEQQEQASHAENHTRNLPSFNYYYFCDENQIENRCTVSCSFAIWFMLKRMMPFLCWSLLGASPPPS